MKKITVGIAQLDLDVVNPRIKQEDNQTEAMRSLLAVEKSGEKVYELARDICEAGMLDPGDRLYVTPIDGHTDRYVALEGNRRLTALRLLSQPGMLDRDDLGLSSSMRNKFKRLQLEFKDRWPVEVDVVVFEDRQAANHFIRLRHTGENAGAGRSAWSALQVARFDNTGVWQCLSYLRESQALDLMVINALDQSAFSITNFDRVSGTFEFQDRFGVSIGKSSFKFTSDKKRGTLALSKLAADVSSGRVDSRGEFSEARHMSGYLAEIERYVQEASQPHKTTSDSSRPDYEPGEKPPSGPESPGPSSGGGKGGGDGYGSTGDDTEPVLGEPHSGGTDKDEATSSPVKPPRKPRTPKYLIDKKDLTTVTHMKCRAIVDELKQKVEVQDAPFACALLLRSLQELTAELYLLAFGIKTTDRSANIEAAANHLLGNQHSTDPANRIELAKALKSSRDTYSTLSNVAHSAVSSVSADHVRNEWANLRGGMDLLWKRIYAQEQLNKAGQK